MAKLAESEENYDDIGDELYESIFETINPKGFAKICLETVREYIGGLEISNENRILINELMT
jgi:hypothetical protein